MRVLRRVILALGVFLAPLGALAQSEPTRIAVVDVERIYAQAAAAEALKAAINQASASDLAALEARKKALLEADQALMRQRAILSKEVFAQKGQELAKQAAALEQDGNALTRKQGAQLQQGMLQVQGALIRVVEQIASENQLDIVLTTRAIMLQADTLDITAEALKRLDAKLPTVALPPAQ